MGRHATPETGAVLVILPGDERLHLVDIRFLHSGQFTDLQNPVPLELFRRRFVVHVRKGKAVRKPLHAKVGDEGTLADALVAVQDDDIIKLDAGLINPRVGGTQDFPCNRPNVLVVLCSKIVDQHRVHPADTVPLRQCLKHLPDRMVGAVIRHFRDGNVIVPRRKGAIARIHIAHKLRIIGIPPELRWMLPGNGSGNLHAVRQLIEHDVLHALVVLHDEDQIPQRVLHGAVLFQFQVGHPFAVIFVEHFCRLRYTILDQDAFHLFILQRKLLHGFEGRQFSHGGIRRHPVIQVAVFVQPNQVKCVQELPTHRVRGVMAVRKLAVVNYHARR